MDRTLQNIALDTVILDGDWPEDKRLTKSIAAQGMLHPIHVYGKEERYHIVAGRGRVTSARALEWTEVEAFVYPSEMQALAAVALAESVRRPNPLSDAHNLVASGLDAKGAHKTAGMTKAQFEAALRLNGLIPELKARLEAGRLGNTAAATLARLQPDDQRAAMGLADAANKQGKDRAKGPTGTQYSVAIREVKFQKQAPLPAFAISQAQATSNGNSRVNHLALVGQLSRLQGDCPDAILLPLLDWLEDQ